MFDFVVKHTGFLKHVPLLPHLFDAFLKIETWVTNCSLLDIIDEIEQEVLSWEGTSICAHRFGGVQFNVGDREIGHVHGNGYLDILFSKKVKIELLQQSLVEEHHVFKKSGWVTLKIRHKNDKKVAFELLRSAYSVGSEKSTLLYPFEK